MFRHIHQVLQQAEGVKDRQRAEAGIFVQQLADRREMQDPHIRAMLILNASRQHVIQQTEQRCAVFGQCFQGNGVAQGGDAQGAIHQQQAFQVILTVDIRRLQQQRGRARAADLMEQSGRVVAIGRLTGQQFEVRFGCLHFLFSLFCSKKSPLSGGPGICLHIADVRHCPNFRKCATSHAE